MNEGREHERWFHTGSIAAMIANSVRDPETKREPWIAYDFHPHYEHIGAGDSPGSDVTPVAMDDMRDLLGYPLTAGEMKARQMKGERIDE